jgi:predicted regulator of Ras-like GTPase activity (Roadblock/LC7/MglB family)
MGFPQLIEEDFRLIESSIQELHAKTDAQLVLLVEKAGHLIYQCGEQNLCPPEVLATLASNSFNAIQFMAGMFQEDKFPGIYQQGEKLSTLILNIDQHCVLVIVFAANLGVGMVKFYAAKTIQRLSDQIKKAEQRAPTAMFDLTDMNVTDVGELFQRKGPPTELNSPPGT